MALRVPLAYPGFLLTRIAIPMLLVQTSISVLNEWADRERDARSARRRPLQAGLLRPGVALATALGLGAAAIAAALLASSAPGATLLLIAGLLAGYAYDLWFKPTPLSFLPFAIAFPLLLVWVRETVSFGPPIALTVLAGAPLAVAIHLADALEDVAVDARAGVRTLAVTLGPVRGIRVCAAALLLGTVVLAASTARVETVMALLVLLCGAGASVALVSGMVSRWIVAVAAGVEVVAWLASAGW